MTFEVSHVAMKWICAFPCDSFVKQVIHVGTHTIMCQCSQTMGTAQYHLSCAPGGC